MAKASNNEFPSVLFTDGTADPSTPSANTARIFVKDDSGAGLYLIDDAGTVTGPFVDASAASGATALAGLDDVGTATPSNDDLLVYATATSTWEPNGSAVVYADGGGREALNTVASSGTALTLDMADGNVHDVTFNNDCTLTFSGTTASVACSFTLIARQDGTGGRTVTWPAAVDWPAGSAVALGTAASNVDVYTFLTVDNGTTWLGFQAGGALS